MQFLLKSGYFKIDLKVTTNFGYFCVKNICLELSKIAQSGPTGTNMIICVQAFNLPHVKLITDSIDEFTDSGIRTKDSSSGKTYDVDVIILATGFSVIESCKNFTAVGKGRKVLHEVWKDEPRMYNGTSFVRSYPFNLRKSFNTKII